MTAAPHIRTGVGAAVGLTLLTAIVFWPVVTFDFVNYDDQVYVTQNVQVQSGLTAESVVWAFTNIKASFWHPLTWLSHMLDCELYGLKAGGHHLSSLILHLANTLLLLTVLRLMTGALWRSVIVAALFALHPLHVESVAWVAERKDVLSTFFFLLTLWAYARHVDESKAQSPKAKFIYAASLGFFALGLMSKPMLVTLPFVLLLLDYWPLRRLQLLAFNVQLLARLLWEKLPFFALTVGASGLAFYTEHKGGALPPLSSVSLGIRLANAITSYVVYLRKMVWPNDLTVFYPFPVSISTWRVVASVVLLTAISGAAVALHRRRPYLAVGWFWYVGTLVPVIGLVQVGGHAMADRYTYIPLIGVFVALVWGVAEATAAMPNRRAVLIATATVVVATCSWMTRAQVQHWRDSLQLFQQAFVAAPPSAVVHDNLGLALLDQKRFAEAKVHFEAVLKIHPNALTLCNLGSILGREGKLDEALRCFQDAVKYEPTNAPAHYNWAFALASAGQPGEAVVRYREALRCDPDYLEALNGLAWLQATHRDAGMRDGAEAVRLAQRAVELTLGRNAGYLDTLAAAHAEAGQFSDATRVARQALDLAVVTGDKTLAAQIQLRLNLYLARQPYRE